MPLFSNTKPNIWFTMGPRTDNDQVLEHVFRAGADGVRLTFSFGTPQTQFDRATRVRAAASRAGRGCVIVADLQGEKIRLGDFGGLNSMAIAEGDDISLVFPPSKFDLQKKELLVNSLDFSSRIGERDCILIGDGSAILEIISKKPKRILCRVLQGGIINPNRGIISQARGFQPRCLTDKDVKDLEAIGTTKHFDAVALSFVTSAEDIKKARYILERENASIPILAKIETRQGLEALPEIAAAADAVMIARGDLALFLPWEEMGIAARHAVRTIKGAGKPWIMATQLVEGLERFAFPTRAEISDLTTWALEGADGFLISYETAFGPRPIDAVSSVRSVLTAAAKGGD
jgi:pyruvate kinase